MCRNHVLPSGQIFDLSGKICPGGGEGGTDFPDRFAKRTNAQYTRYMAAPAMPFGMYARWATIKLHGKKDAKLYSKK